MRGSFRLLIGLQPERPSTVCSAGPVCMYAKPVRQEDARAMALWWESFTTLIMALNTR